MVESSNNQPGGGEAIGGSGSISPIGVEEPLLVWAVVLNKSVLFLAFNIPWAPGPVPWGVLGLNG